MVLVSGIMWFKTSSYQISGVDIAASFLIVSLKLFLKCIVTRSVFKYAIIKTICWCLRVLQVLHHLVLPRVAIVETFAGGDGTS